MWQLLSSDCTHQSLAAAGTMKGRGRTYPDDILSSFMAIFTGWGNWSLIRQGPLKNPFEYYEVFLVMPICFGRASRHVGYN